MKRAGVIAPDVKDSASPALGSLDKKQAREHPLGMAPSSPRVKKILAEAAELPEDERAELAHELLRLIPADEYESEWIEEITWRAERVLRGESNGKAVDDAGLSAIFYGDNQGPAT